MSQQTDLARAERLLDGKTHNVLVPTEGVLGRIDEFYVARLTVVEIDPQQETFQVKDDQGNVMRALSGSALKKLASGAGIDLLESEYIGAPTPDFFAWRVKARMKGPDGAWRTGIASVEWSREAIVQPVLDEIAKLEAEYEERRGKGENTGSEAMRKLAARIYGKKKQANDLIIYRVPMAESKALNRAIRQLLGVKPKYTPQEVARPFTIVRVDRSPDIKNDRVMELLRAQAGAAQAALYGGGDAPALPEIAGGEVAAVDPDDYAEPLVESFDEETGEIIEGPSGVPLPEADVEDFDDSGFLDETPSGPAEDPGAFVLTSGVFAGKTLRAVEEEKPGYVQWILNSGKGSDALRAACQAYADSGR